MAKKKLKSTLKRGGRNYKKVSCSSTKTGATATAKRMRKAGKTAIVVKQGDKHCIFSAGKRKATSRKRA